MTARARSTGGVHGTYGHAAPQTQDLRFDLLTVAASWGGLFAAGSPSTLYLRSASQQQVVVRGQGAHAARDHRSTGMDPQHQTGARGDRTQQMDVEVEPLRLGCGARLLVPSSSRPAVSPCSPAGGHPAWGRSCHTHANTRGFVRTRTVRGSPRISDAPPADAYTLQPWPPSSLLSPRCMID